MNVVWLACRISLLVCFRNSLENRSMNSFPAMLPFSKWRNSLPVWAPAISGSQVWASEFITCGGRNWPMALKEIVVVIWSHARVLCRWTCCYFANTTRLGRESRTNPFSLSSHCLTWSATKPCVSGIAAGANSPLPGTPPGSQSAALSSWAPLLESAPPALRYKDAVALLVASATVITIHGIRTKVCCCCCCCCCQNRRDCFCIWWSSGSLLLMLQVGLHVLKVNDEL